MSSISLFPDRSDMYSTLFLFSLSLSRSLIQFDTLMVVYFLHPKHVEWDQGGVKWNVGSLMTRSGNPYFPLLEPSNDQ